jgi:putative glycosyltransferase
MRLSIVATLYHSAAHIAEFVRRSAAAAERLVGDNYEIILVNDGSPDDSLDVAVRIAEQNPRLVVVDLSRNFGHHKAMMTGLTYARGERVFLIDSDLEEEPEWMIDFAAQMESESCDVVFGVQAKRKGGFFERWSGQWFYILFRIVTGVALPENIVTARLMTRRYVDALVRHEEREVFMAGLWLITGFVQHPHTVTKHSTSETTYTLRKKLTILVNSITSFSSSPLVGIFIVGCVIFVISGLYGAYLVANWLFLGVPPSGYTSLMASVWLLGGMISAFIGIVGIYLSKIYSETKRRPYTIVRSVFNERSDRNRNP